MAVAGIRRPPADFRSPLPGVRTINRSPVSRSSEPPAFLARGRRAFEAEVRAPPPPRALAFEVLFVCAIDARV
jgi:hypothetical protein